MHRLQEQGFGFILTEDPPLGRAVGGMNENLTPVRELGPGLCSGYDRLVKVRDLDSHSGSVT